MPKADKIVRRGWKNEALLMPVQVTDARPFLQAAKADLSSLNKGTCDKCHAVEKPSEVKVSCSVLARRESRASCANSANDWGADSPGDFLLSVPT